MVVVLAVTLGALRLAHAPPFVQYVRVPRVLGMKESDATRRVRDAGLAVRIVSLRRSIPSSLSHHVLGASSAPNERLAKGSTVTLYVAIQRAARRHKAHS
jgi:beta-lactam-binding protein with PASTA domain